MKYVIRLIIPIIYSAQLGLIFFEIVRSSSLVALTIGKVYPICMCIV